MGRDPLILGIAQVPWIGGEEAREGMRVGREGEGGREEKKIE